MSGAAAARDAVRKVLEALYKPTFLAGRDYAAAYQRAVAADDLVETLGHTVDMILAAEHLEKIADEAAKAARASLAATMEAVGCFNIHSGTDVSAHLHRKPTVLSIDPKATIASEYLIQPAPVPDRKRIRAAIEAGQDVPGCSIIRPNELSLVLRSARK